MSDRRFFRKPAILRFLVVPLLSVTFAGLLIMEQLRNIEAAVTGQIMVQLSWAIGDSCSDGVGGCEFNYRRTNYENTSHKTDGVYAANNNSTAFGECDEDDWPLGSDYDSCTTAQFFRYYNNMYVQDLTRGYQPAGAGAAGLPSCSSFANGNACPINNVTVRRVYPRLGEGTESLTATPNGAEAIQINYNPIDLNNYPVPTNADHFRVRIDTVTNTQRGYTVPGCGTAGFYSCLTVTSPFTLFDASFARNNLPSGNWMLHIQGWDNAGTPTAGPHMSASMTIPDPNFIAITSPFALNDGVDWVPASPAGNNGISGTQYRFGIVWRSADDGAYNGHNGDGKCPEYARVIINRGDVDGDSLVTDDYLTLDMGPDGDANLVEDTAGGTNINNASCTRARFLNGMQYVLNTNLTYASSSLKGAWKFKFEFKARNDSAYTIGLESRAAVTGKTVCWPNANCAIDDSTAWRDFEVAPVKLNYFYSGHVANTSVVSGAWQSQAIDEPTGGDRNFDIRIRYRFSGAQSIVPKAIDPTKVVGHFVAGNVGAYPADPASACFYVPRAEVDVDAPVLPDGSVNAGYGTPDYCIALGHIETTSDPYESIFSSGSPSSGTVQKVQLPFVNCREGKAANCAFPATNPPLNHPDYADSGNKGHRYRFRLIFDDGPGSTPASGQFPDGDVMKDITGGDNIADSYTTYNSDPDRDGSPSTSNDTKYGFRFENYSPFLSFVATCTSGAPTCAVFPDGREIKVKKNPIVVDYVTVAGNPGFGANDDATTPSNFGRGISPNCAYGGFLTGDGNTVRLNGDPLKGGTYTNTPIQCNSIVDSATILSPAWTLKVRVWDPDGVQPSTGCTSTSNPARDCDDHTITSVEGGFNAATDGLNPSFILSGLDMDDDGLLGGTAVDQNIREVNPMSCTDAPDAYTCGAQADAEYCKMRNNGKICSYAISAGKLRFINEGAISTFDGILRYSFAVRTRYYSGSSRAAGTQGINYIWEMDPKGAGTPTGMTNPLEGFDTNKNGTGAVSPTYIYIVNNNPFITWATGNGPVTADACYDSNAYDTGGVNPPAAFDFSNSTKVSCHRGGENFEFRIRYYDYDGYTPGRGVWRPQEGFVHGGNTSRARIHLDLNNDGDYSDADAYPYSDVTFENAGEKLNLSLVSNTIRDSSNVVASYCSNPAFGNKTACLGGGGGWTETNPAIGEEYYFTAPHVYANATTYKGMVDCAPATHCNKYAQHGFRFVIGDDSFDSSSFPADNTNPGGFNAANPGTWAGWAIGTGVDTTLNNSDDQHTGRTIDVVNNDPKVVTCGQNETGTVVTNWTFTGEGTRQFHTNLTYDYTPVNTPGTKYPGNTTYNTEYGGFNNDYLHPLDISDVYTANPDPDGVYIAGNEVNPGGPVSGRDQTYNNDAMRFCLRYVDEDRWPPFQSPSVCSAMAANQTGPCMGFDPKGTGLWGNVTLTKLGQALPASGANYTTFTDNDAAAATNALPADANDPLRKGIVYFYQTVVTFPDNVISNGPDIGEAQGNFRIYSSGAQTGEPGFTDASGLQLSNVTFNWRVVRVAPEVSPLYVWNGVTQGTGTLDVHYVHKSTATTGAPDPMTSNTGSSNDVWPLPSIYRIENSASAQYVKTEGTTVWSGSATTQERAIDYYSQYVAGTTAESPSNTGNPFTSQRYLGGIYSGCVTGNTSQIHHVKKLSGNPHNQENTGCGNNAVTIGANGASLVDIFTPLKNPHANNAANETLWESFGSFTYAWPDTSKGKVLSVGSPLGGSLRSYLYGYTGTVFRFGALWWRPNSFVQPTEAAVGVDLNRDGKYSQDEMSYYIYGNTRSNPYAKYASVKYGSEFGGNDSTYFKCNAGQVPTKGGASAIGLSNCKPYIFFANIRDVGATSVSEGTVLAFHYAFKFKDFKFPVFRHGLTADLNSEMYMGQINEANPGTAKINMPLMHSFDQVKPFDPYLMVKYRKAPTLEAFPVEKNGTNKYRFKVRFYNPYRVAPACSGVAGTSQCADGHRHIKIDLNGNGVCGEANEIFPMNTLLTEAAATPIFGTDGYVDFVYPPDFQDPLGVVIPYGDINRIKFCFDFAEYRYDGTGDDQGLAAASAEIPFDLKDYSEPPVVINNNYQKPDSEFPVKILIGRKDSSGGAVKGKVSIRIYSTSGRLVYDGQGKWLDLDIQDQFNPLVWRLVSNSGEKVGSGVYLMVAVRKLEGKDNESPIKYKIVVVR